jgi:hypothetical protein
VKAAGEGKAAAPPRAMCREVSILIVTGPGVRAKAAATPKLSTMDTIAREHRRPYPAVILNQPTRRGVAWRGVAWRGVAWRRAAGLVLGVKHLTSINSNAGESGL